jgi:hypothetical protein
MNFLEKINLIRTDMSEFLVTEPEARVPFPALPEKKYWV